MAFGFTLGSLAVATALAFGLGGRDAAKSIEDHWAAKLKQKRPEFYKESGDPEPAGPHQSGKGERD